MRFGDGGAHVMGIERSSARAGAYEARLARAAIAHDIAETSAFALKRVCMLGRLLMFSPIEMTLTELRDAIAGGRVSSAEATQAYLDAIGDKNIYTSKTEAFSSHFPGAMPRIAANS